MTEYPQAYEPEADVPLDPNVTQGVTDPNLLEVISAGEAMKRTLRDRLPGGPTTELAVRYVDLAVQAAHGTAQAGGTETPGARAE